MINPLKQTIRAGGFDSVFSEMEHQRQLNLPNRNCLRFFHMEIRNNEFSLEGLYRFLQKNIGSYVFSRASIENFYLEGEEQAIGLRAIELLRTASNPNDLGAGGELGEILLYLFLEQKLNAPKLLSKVELKTTNGQYVFGSDGVHLLQINGQPVPFFQLILGESKIQGDLKSAVDSAFKSIAAVSKGPSNEIRLIEKNLLAESFDPAKTEFIKSLIVPSKRDLSINVDNAFGIFLGYSLNLEGSQMSNDEYRMAAAQKMADDIQGIAPYIEEKIRNTGLSGYSFYIYVIPFNNAAKDRAAIIMKLKGGD